MAKIRQEINLTASASFASNPGIVQLDTSQYSGTITCYFETVGQVASGTLTASLRRVGTSTDDASISVTATSFTRQRSSSFTPPTGATEYFLFMSGGTSPNVKSARIIIIQDTGTDPLTSTETQIEIGSQTTGLSNTTLIPFSNPKYWYYDSSKWDGTITFSAEITYDQGSTMKTTTVTLQEDDGSFGSWTNVATIVDAGSSATATRVRSAAFTPTSGRHYRIAHTSSSNMIVHGLYCAKIIVRQEAIAVSEYYFDASISGPTDAQNIWTNDALAFNGLTGSGASISSGSGSDTNNALVGGGTTAPTSGDEIKKVDALVRNSGDNISFQVYTQGKTQLLGTSTGGLRIVLDTPSGGWTWAKVNQLEIYLYAINNFSTVARYYAVVVDSYDGSAITKLEPQYLIISGSSSTGLSDNDTLYDPAEWDTG